MRFTARDREPGGHRRDKRYLREVAYAHITLFGALDTAPSRPAAERLGASEVLLRSNSGHVLEGTFSTLFWWRGDTLHTTSLALGILPGVTRQLLLDLAARRRQRVEFATCRPSDLHGCELWMTSALHRIRGVIGWAGQPWSVAQPDRAPEWQLELAMEARRVHSRDHHVTGAFTHE